MREPSVEAVLRDPVRLRVLRETSLLDSAPEPAFDRVTRLVARLLDAPVSMISFVDDRRQFIKSHVGLAPPWSITREAPVEASLCAVAMSSPSPFCVRDARDEPALRDHGAVRAGGLLAYAGVPLVSAEGHPLGMLCAVDTRPRDWSPDDLATLAELAEVIVTEVELRRSVARDRAHRRRAADDLAFLARAGDALAASLDLDTTVRALTDLAVPARADGCVVLVRGGDDRLEILTMAHTDPARAERLRSMHARNPLPDDAPYGAPNVLRTRRSEFIPVVDLGAMAAMGADPEHAAALRATALRSWIMVPLVARDRVIGALGLSRYETEAPFDEADLAVAEELARLAAVALENARLFEAARRAGREAEVASRAKDEFLSTLSHELRTPLHAILGWTQLLRGGALPDASREHALAVIERNARAQSQLVEDLLDVGRITSGTLRLTLDAVDPAAVVRAALDAVVPSVEARGQRLDVSLAPDVGLVSADAPRLQQVVWNLVSNASRFTPPGGALTVTLRHDADVELTVSDTGMGIEPAFLPHVFERFRQADGSTARRHGGLGLGLAIVRHLVELHGGVVTARSDGAGRGATFTVRLPAMTSAPSAAAALSVEPAAPWLTGLRVLVVDDEADARELVEALLAPRGVRVTLAASAAEGYAALCAQRPDALVTDIGMPGEDGFALLARVRALDVASGGATPVVGLSAYARPEDRALALASGFTAYLVKPFEPDSLYGLLAQLTGRAR